MRKYDELKRLAEEVLSIEAAEDRSISAAYDAYESAASPAAILELIAENERLERNRDMWKGQVERQSRVLTRISQLCTAQHESKEAFARRVQSVIEWGGRADG